MKKLRTRSSKKQMAVLAFRTDNPELEACRLVELSTIEPDWIIETI